MGPSITVTRRLWLQWMRRAQPWGCCSITRGRVMGPQEMEGRWSPLHVSKPAWLPSLAVPSAPTRHGANPYPSQ